VLVDIPDSVSRAQLRTNQSGFELSSELVCADLPFASGVILASKRREAESRLLTPGRWDA
jgi:hypothetical protein